MTTAYPGAIDAFTNPTSSDTLDSVTVPHATQHANINDAVEAIETTLGVNPQGGSATVVARLNANDTAVGLKAPLASPTLVTPVLGVATATSINGSTIPTSKTLVVTTDKISALATTTSAELAGVISDETGSGALVFATSPSLITPVLGVASATDITISGKLVKSVTNAITASTTQTQAGATALTTDINRITVVANADDAVKLPAATAGRQVTVINTVATQAGVFPASGDAINALAVDAVSPLAASTTRTYTCAVAGTWNF